MYCEATGATAPTGPCAAGHICYGRAILADPIYNDDPGPDENNKTKTIVTFGDSCSPGHYCPEGTTILVPCPAGTYRSVRQSIERRRE